MAYKSYGEWKGISQVNVVHTAPSEPDDDDDDDDGDTDTEGTDAVPAVPVTSNSNNNNNQSAAHAPTNPPGRHTRSNSALGSGREVSDDASNPKAAREINKLGGWLGVAGNDLDALSETENSETNFVKNSNSETNFVKNSISETSKVVVERPVHFDVKLCFHLFD